MRTGEGGPVIAVGGHIRHSGGSAAAGTGSDVVLSGVHLVCSTRLIGYDTFLSGVVTLHGGQEVKVRILTFDDFTVLLPRDEVHGWADGQAWSGVLRLRHPARKVTVPDDVAEALAAAGLDESAYDAAELTHLLTWLAEAADPHLRQQRLVVVVRSLAARPATGSPDPAGAA